MDEIQPLNLWDRRFNKSEDILVVPEQIKSSLERLLAGPNKAVRRQQDIRTESPVYNQTEPLLEKISSLRQDEISRGRFASVRSSEHIYEAVVGSAAVSPSPSRKEQLEEVKDSARKDIETASVSAGDEDQKSKMGSKIMSRDFWKRPGKNGAAPDVDEEEIDFTPQNGYIEDEDDMESASQTGGKDRKSRDRTKKPGIGQRMKKIRVPSPGEMVHGYMHSNFHQKNFSQPLACRTRVEDQEMQRQRQLLVENSTVGELASLNHPFDIPLPKLGKNRSKSRAEPELEENPPPNKFYGTLPKSWREQNLVTGVKENQDPALIAERQELVKNKTPAELAKITSLGDIPVPAGITNMFTMERKKKAAAPAGTKRRHSASAADAEADSWTKSLPRSWKDTKLITNMKENKPNEVLKQRQELVATASPSKLASMSGISDIPVPAPITNLFKSRSRSGSVSKDRGSKSRKLSSGNRSVSISRSMGTLPKAWKDTKLVTKQLVEDDQDRVTSRKALIEARTPAQLSQITSVADFPIPDALTNFLKSSEKKPNEPKDTANMNNSTSNLEDMYSTLPRALKAEILVRTKVEEDEEVLKKRQKIVETMKPSELASFHSIGDFPIPSRLENIFKSSDKQERASRFKSKEEIEGKRKRNRSLGALLTYEGLPDSLKSEVLVRSKVEEDPEELRARQELVKSKTPSQLASMSGLSDFPLPRKIDTMVRPGRRTLKSTKQKELEKKKSKSWASLPESTSLFTTLSRPLKQDLEVTRKDEDQELVKKRMEVLKNKSVADLGAVTSLSDFPIPAPIENLINPSKRSKSIESKRAQTPAGESEKKTMYEKLPQSLKSEVLVRAKDEDPDLQKYRQELTRSKTPNELGNISSLSDIPVPSPIQNLFGKRSDVDSPVPPPRRKDGAKSPEPPKSMYEKLPESLKTELLVRTVEGDVDEKTLAERQELTRAKSPAQLGQIHGFSDFPVPQLFGGKKEDKLDKKKSEEKEENENGETGLYATLPKSLKSEVMVRAKVEDPLIQKERAEMVKSKSVHELAQISSFSDIPVPSFISRGPRPVERKKRFREKQKSASTRSLSESGLAKSLKSELLVKSTVQDQGLMEQRRLVAQSKSVQELSQIRGFSDFPIPGTLERLLSKSKTDVAADKGISMSNLSVKNMYGTMPKSLTQEVMVRSRFEDPQIQSERRTLTQSKSVSELSRIHGLSDFPVPATIERLLGGRGGGNKDKDNMSHAEGDIDAPKGLYASLPQALKSEVLVRSRVEDPEILRERQAMVASKSVSELSKVTGLSDIPIPATISNLMSGKTMSRKSSRAKSKEQINERDRSESSRPGSRGPPSEIYATLPRSLTQELHVRSKEGGNEKVMKERKNLVEEKSPGQLGQIHSFSEIPVPRMIENWLSNTDNSLESSSKASKSAHELRGGGMYETLPRSLKEPVLVGATVEDPEVTKERAELARAKTPSQLAEFHGIGDIPIPGLWAHNTAERPKRSKKKAKEVPEEPKKPGTLSRPCVVRSKIEKPEVLRQRQELQKSKSIHELSKIGNINEIPFPFRVPLPDIPLPKPTAIFKMIGGAGKKKPAATDDSTKPSKSSAAETGFTPSASPVTNPDTTDAEMLRYETSSIENDGTHREQDFGYEVIDQTAADISQIQDDIDMMPEEELDGLTPTLPPKQSARQAPKGRKVPPPTDVGDEELAEQYRGTPERKVPSRSKRRQQQQARSPGRTEIPSSSSMSSPPPPPLPPKQPGGRREEIIDDFEEDDEEDMEVVPVKGILTLEATNGNVHVRKNEFKSSQSQPPRSRSPRLATTDPASSASFLTEVGFSDSPTPPPSLPAKTKVGSGVDSPINRGAPKIVLRPGDLPETSDEESVERIQSRPLPAPPAPKRTLRKSKSPKATEKHPSSPALQQTADLTTTDMSSSSATMVTANETLAVPTSSGQRRPGSSVSNHSATSLSFRNESSFHTAPLASSLDATLVDSSEARRRHAMEDDDETLADSVVDSMHSCADTLVGSEDDLTLHGDISESASGGVDGGDDTDMEDEEFLSEHFSTVPADTTEESMQHYVQRMRTSEQHGSQQGENIIMSGANILAPRLVIT